MKKIQKLPIIIFLVFAFIFFFACSSAPVNSERSSEPMTKRAEVSSNAPQWASKVHFVDNGTHYFVGRSSGIRDEGECHEKALRDAVHQVSKYAKVELRSLSKSYEEMLTGEDAEMVMAVSTEKGAQITLKEYFSDYFSESTYDGGSVVKDCYVKISLSSSDMEEIRIQASDITAWKMDIAQDCSEKELLTALFRSMASMNGWKLTKDQVGNAQSGYAFFAETSVTCSNQTINIVTTRTDLISESIVQTIFASGNDINELKKNYFAASGIYLPVVNYAEHANVKKDGVFSDLDLELLKLYNDAYSYESKGRLFPEKAMNSWTNLYNYSDENPFRTLAKERIDFYKNMDSAMKTTESVHDADLKKIEQIVEMTSLPAERIASDLIRYIETYGAFVGRKGIDKLINAVSPDEKKSEVISVLFGNSEVNTKWISSCKAGNGAFCYLYSFSKNYDARDVKKKACLLSVKNACAELAEDAIDLKQGQSALFFGEKACHFGEMEWCFKAAKILYSGENGVKVDVVKALPLLKDSCESNDVKGCAYLGFMCEKGEGVAQDNIKAKEYYDKACSLGFKDSCNKIKE